jgi:multiple sugar transport system ATP-binding protein
MDGAMLQVDSPDVVYNDPKDLRVAEFIGSPKINVLATAIKADGLLAVDGKCRIPAAEISPDKLVRLAFRPEHAALADPDKAQMRGDVAYLENLGSDLLVHIRVGNQEKSRLVVRTAPNGRRYHIGENIGIDLSVKRPLLFDEQGKRIAMGPTENNCQREAVHG